MVKYIKASQGCKFVLTEFGLEQNHVRTKYKNGEVKNKYEKSVPQAWIDKGYVCEIKEG